MRRPGNMTVVNNITERKAAEAGIRALNESLKQLVAARTSALAESKERFRVIFEQAAVGAAQIDIVTGRFVRVNQKYADLVGYTPEEMRALDFQSLTYPDDMETVLADMEHLKRGEIRELEMEKRYFRKDSRVIWVKLTVSAMWALGVTPDYYIAIVQDITARKQAEVGLLHAKENAEHASAELNAYIEAIGKLALVSVTDRSGRILQANTIFCEVSGYSEAELIGQDHRILNSGTHPKAFFVDMWATIARGEVWHQEICNRSKSGQFYWVDSTIVPLKDNHGQVVRYLSVRVDITARKHKELVLRERLKESTCLYAIRRSLVLDSSLEEVCQIVLEQLIAAMQFPQITSIMIELDDRQFVSDRYDKELTRGLQAQIMINGETHGWLRVFYSEDRPFLLPEEQDLIDTITDDLGRWLERKQTRDLLHVSELRLNEAQRLAKVGSWELDFVSGKLHGSNEVFRIFEIDPNLFGGRYEDFLNVIHPDDRNAVDWAHNDSLTAHSSSEITYRLRMADGRIKWISEQCETFYGNQGKALRSNCIVQDVTERKRMERRIVEMATHDALTGLPNRHLLQDRIAQALAHGRRSGEQAAVLFIDLDHFKVINDSLGHDVGDSLLQEVAARLTATMRSEDTAVRQGGDEFIVLLPNLASALDAEAVAQKILDELTQPYHIHEKELHIGASIGIALFPDDGKDVEALLKNSDIAMYHAKESGRNNYQFFSPEMNKLAKERHSLGVDLRHALARNELLLYFQPVVDMPSGKLTSMEVLLRWQHPEQGLILPSRFIPLAEESGLIVPIGEWVLQQSCLQIRAWQEQGYDVPKLAVNLSARQFRHKTLVANVARILAETGVEGHCLTLEITESELVENVEKTIVALQQLNALGLEIAVDDFGTGYSSLSYLKRYPVNTLKIDRSFVRDIATDPNDAAIIAAIIAMARSLKMKVIAEGVETEEQLAFLTQQGCSRYQGYYFSQPLSAAEFENKQWMH